MPSPRCDHHNRTCRDQNQSAHGKLLITRVLKVVNELVLHGFRTNCGSCQSKHPSRQGCRVEASDALTTWIKLALVTLAVKTAFPQGQDPERSSSGFC